MGLKRTDEFCQNTVPIVLIIALMSRQEAYDLGVGASTLNKRIMAHRNTDLVSKKDLNVAKESDRTRREIRILKEVWEIPKKMFWAPASIYAVSEG